MAWPMIAMMAASAAAKNKGDEAAAERERYNQQMTARYAPWTGMNPGGMDKTNPNLGADLSQAAVAGMMMDQNMTAADMDNKLAQAKIESLTGQKAAADAKTPMTTDLPDNSMDGGLQQPLPAELTRDFSTDPRRKPVNAWPSMRRSQPIIIV